MSYMNNNYYKKITINSTLKFPEDTTSNKERTVKNIPWLKYYSYEDFTKEITNGYIIYPLNKIHI